MKIGQETALLTKINRRFIELSISQQKTAICTAEYSTYIEIEEEKKSYSSFANLFLLLFRV